MSTDLVLNEFTLSELVAIGSFVLPLLAFAFTSLRYVNVKRNEQKQLRFENYHQLIHKLVNAGTDRIGMDSQRAVIYELRSYREYKEVTLRILSDLKELWVDNKALIKEIDLTIESLNRKGL